MNGRWDVAEREVSSRCQTNGKMTSGRGRLSRAQHFPRVAVVGDFRPSTFRGAKPSTQGKVPENGSSVSYI